jgi:hypothetical protein
MSNEMEPLMAVSLRKPLRPWGFPNGHVCPVREIDGYMRKLIRDAKDSGSEEQYNAFYRLLVPEATEEDWLTMTEEDLANLLGHASRKLDEIQKIYEEHRKNEGAGTVAPPTTRTRRSSPKTASTTSAPASPAPSAAASLP